MYGWELLKSFYSYRPADFRLFLKSLMWYSTFGWLYFLTALEHISQTFVIYIFNGCN